MNLVKAGGTIGGLTLVSRILGFVREMVFSRVMGASAAADLFVFAFTIPNQLRRLLGEGAFSQGFVPLFARLVGKDGDLDDAKRFAEEVQAVFLPALILITAIFVVGMPLVVAAIADESWRADPVLFGQAVDLTRITFPYLIFIALVALFSGILNSLSRFAVAAFVPALLNVALVGALLLVDDGGLVTARALAWGVIVGGVIQLGTLVIATRRAGLALKILPPRMTPRVKELLKLMVPATIAAGGYYISQLFYLKFATRLPDGSLVYLSQADRLNQLPLALIGSAIGVAILPAISRHIGQAEHRQASNVQSRATELAMLLTLPATIALIVIAGPIMTVLFEGGRFTEEDAAVSGAVLSYMVLGLPAYVMIKILAPGFFARKDMKTPAYITMSTLALSVAIWFGFIDEMGIVILPIGTAIAAWVNALTLYVLLHRRGHFSFEPWLVARLLKQIFCAGVMAAILYVLSEMVFADWFAAGAGRRSIALLVTCGAGGLAYLVLAWVIGAMDKKDILLLLGKSKFKEA
ncbi:murein biosynthesis integral membrane protein MurJ [Sphingomicrobium aestuariivivum]|uniref:murein biosynthesis integral membrane protein MurJ n=1 Tax=Sphingomicrobium aestuariivivum TaxID=1582356 RepID=UPI001FD70012|nr:murein biosynthesis integral membrane protein MurJ [Sphingomicrobium aestuariivivum]MCJ8190140.1 murein biosynthesis integral membrane protein MurJ [Sphingomicrobium aestuariivivum]